MSVSAWIIIFTLMIAVPIGMATHWIVGVILFFMIAGKALIYGIVLDTISDTMRYHHDRNDSRMKKTLESINYMRIKK
jgi:uncharacterized membrane protein YhaH (DUF805 family)